MSRETAQLGLIKASRIVLGELAEILESYPRAVIAGGFVPYLLIPQDVEPHEGTVDIDLVLDLDQPGSDSVYTLHEVFDRRLFIQDERRPFRYHKDVDVRGEHFEVLVELLGGGEPPANGLRRISTEDVYVSVIQGMEVALVGPLDVQLPGGAGQSVSVASLPAFFAMKAVALERRSVPKKSKDAYDIVYCLRNYPGGEVAIAEGFAAVSASPLVRSGIALLEELFASTDAVGPVAYAEDAPDDDDAALMRREAFERVNELLLRLKK